MGTVRYMSPEQARGQKVDARRDIFSLGVVLYEMIAGRAPFEGATSSDVIAGVLAREPLPLTPVLTRGPAGAGADRDESAAQRPRGALSNRCKDCAPGSEGL